MDQKPQDNRYEQLYGELRSRSVWLHQRNKDMIRYGSIGLLVMPVILFVIRWLTDSNKVVFLLLWIFGIIALSAFLIGVEYFDQKIQKALKDITDWEEEFDSLVQRPAKIPGKKLAQRIASLPDRVDVQEYLKMYGPGPKGKDSGEDGDEQ